MSNSHGNYEHCIRAIEKHDAVPLHHWLVSGHTGPTEKGKSAKRRRRKATGLRDVMFYDSGVARQKEKALYKPVLSPIRGVLCYFPLKVFGHVTSGGRVCAPNTRVSLPTRGCTGTLMFYCRKLTEGMSIWRTSTIRDLDL